MQFTESDLDFVSNELDAEFTRFNNVRALSKPCVLEERRFGTALAFLDKNRPKAAYYNRVTGFREDDLPHVDEIIDWYRQNEINCLVSLSPNCQSKRVLTEFYDKGFKYIESDCLYYRIPEVKPIEILENVRVELVTEKTLNTLFDLFTQFGVNVNYDVKNSVLHHYLGDGFKFYIAFVKDVPVATGSMFTHNGACWLSNAETLDDYRGRGCQSLLLRTRVNAASEQGCKMVLTDTEFGSTSHRNILRSGFHIAYMTAEMKLSW